LVAAQQEVERLTKLHSQAQKYGQETAESLAALQDEHAQLQRKFKQAASDRTDPAELEELRAEKEALRAKVDNLEQRLAEVQASAAQPTAEDSQQFEDLQRRFQMAVDDVRQLKRKNAELEETISEYKAGGGSAIADTGGTDWESTKKRLLASLDDDVGTPGAMRKEDRLTVEGAIQITDDIVRQRDAEIEELRAQLGTQGSAGGTTSGDELDGSSAQADPAVAAALDQDEIIRQERERLKSLETEWEEKVRVAEIELSVHRAKISRERVELEEELRRLEEAKESLKAEQAACVGQPAGKARKPARKWLERLGLKDSDKDS
jgi:hypothetical protein